MTKQQLRAHALSLLGLQPDHKGIVPMPKHFNKGIRTEADTRFLFLLGRKAYQYLNSVSKVKVKA